MDQHTASPPDVDRTQPEFDRRRGPRRADAADVPFEERRQGDRRKRKPGLAGLWGALFGRREDDEPAL